MPALPSSLLLPLGGERGASGYLEVRVQFDVLSTSRFFQGKEEKASSSKEGRGNAWIDMKTHLTLTATPLINIFLSL